MKSAWRWEQQKARVRSPPCLWYRSRAFAARAFRGDGGFEGRCVESGAPPRDVLVVDLVGDPDVAEGYEALALDAFEKIASVDEGFAAESEQVASVGALGGSGETEKKFGLEVVINQ